MLKTLRKNKSSYVGLVVVGFCALLMVGFGIDFLGGGGRATEVASVNDQVISYNEYYKRYQNLSQRYRDQLGGAFDQFRGQLNLEQQAIDQLVNDVLIRDFTTELGLGAGPEQVKEYLASLPYFGGQIDQNSYRSYLRAARLSATQLEALTKDDIVRKQLTSLLGDIAVTTDSELRSVYKQDNTKFKLNYLTLKAADFEDKVDSQNEEKLLGYFEENSEKYKKPRSIKFNYVQFSVPEYRAKVVVEDEDLLALYEETQNEYSEPPQVRLKRILFKLEEEKDKQSDDSPIPGLELEDDSEEEPAVSEFDANAFIREKANGIADRLEDGESFDDLAKEYSEDEATREQGGDVGWKNYENLDKKVREAALELGIDEHSRPIETANGLEIIYVTDAKDRRQKPFEEVRTQVEAKLREQDASLYAFATAEEFLDDFNDENATAGTSFADYAAQREMTAKSTGELVGPGDTKPDTPIGLMFEIQDRDVGERDVIEIGNIIYVIDVEETKDPYIPELEDVRDKVIKDFTAQESKNLALAFAEQLVAEAVYGEEAQEIPEVAAISPKKTLVAIAEAHELELSSTDAVTRKEASGEVFSASGTKDALMTLSSEKSFPPRVFDSGTTFYLIELAERTAPDEAGFADERETLVNTEASSKQRRVQESFIQHLRKNAVISIDAKLLEQV